MKNLKKPTIDDEGKKVCRLKSAKIKGYKYTKTYYKMENGVPVKCENGDDSYLTVINIRKCGDETKKKRTFILSEGYIGAEKSYNEDGTKRNSITRKDGFGMSYFNYIVLPVNLEFSDAIHSLVKHGQIMPLVLFAKKKLMQRTEEGEGITTYKEQGVFRKGLKVGKTVIHGSHDMGASSGDGKPNKAKDGKQGRLGALETIAKEFLEK